VQRRELPEPGDAFADRVKDGMTWEELDAKLKEGMELEAEERRQQNTRRAVRKALVASLPEEFEIPETLLEQVVKERFANALRPA
jgi:FKBP-type peptidyl-prolyl cis-trans isomerase (trigger factor)